MVDKEIISLKALRKLDAIILHNDALLKNKELQQELISWAENMLAEARKEWESMRTVSIDAIISCDRKKEAKRKASIKDKKYAPFREYFKKIQKEKYDKAIQNGCKLTALGFVNWFLSQNEHNIPLPYVKQNRQNKLIQLAQINNREFKKASAC